MHGDITHHHSTAHGNLWSSTELISLFSVGIILFGIAAASYFTESMLYLYDQPLHLWMSQMNETAPQELLLVAKIVNGIPNLGIPLALIGLTIWWYRHDRYRPAALLFFGTLGQFLIFLAVGFAIGRERPQLTGSLKYIPLPGFPSGHVMTMVTFSTLALSLGLPTLASRWNRWIVAAGVLFFTLLIGFLRLFLLAHYLTDVIAGYGLGLICAIVVFVTVNSFFDERDSRRMRQKNAEP